MELNVSAKHCILMYSASCVAACCSVGYIYQVVVAACYGNKYNTITVIMVALWNRADHYTFMLWFLLSSFFTRLISAAAYWMSAILPHMLWCGLSVNLRGRSETCCTRLAEKYRTQKVAKIAIWAPSHKFVGLCLRN